MKKAFTLTEILLSTVIISIVVITSLNIMNILHKKNNTTYQTTISKIDLESTRLFLEKKIILDKQLSNLSFKESGLYYKNDLLLKNVSLFSKTIQDDIITLEICTNNSTEICTKTLLK